MDMVLPPELRFDQYRVDGVNGRLYLGDETIELRPKSFDVLHYLVSNAGRVIGKDELFATVWPKVVVGDDSLVQCIGDIRQALRDDRQRIIRTVPRRGYIFTRPVIAQENDQVQASAVGHDDRPRTAAVGEPGASKPYDAWHKWLIGLIALMVVGVGAGWLATRPADRRTTAERSASDTPVPLSARAPPLSIVVLPLANVNGDREQEYFAEGLTADLTTDLSRIPGSFVIDRGSAYSYQGQPIDVREIGRELGVRYVLEGSVQRLDDQVRLNVQLIDAETGRELWADRFDGNRRRLTALQDQVTGTIARTLDVELIEAESQRARRERPSSPDAQDLIMQGSSLLERRTPQSVEAARDMLQRAVSLDPQSAIGWSLLADTYTADVLNRWMHFRHASRGEWLQRAEQVAGKGYELDSNNLYAIGAWATVLQLRGNSEQALGLFQKQVSLNRNYAPAWHRISYSYVALGNPEAAISAGEQAIRLSPRDGHHLYSIYTIMAAAYLHLGRDSEALEWAKKAVQSRPDFAVAYAWMAAAAANLNRMDEAHNALARFRLLQPDYTVATFRAEKLSDDPVFLAQHERYYEGLRKAGLPE